VTRVSRFALGSLLAAGLLAAALLRLERSAAGPVEPSWGGTTCAHCGMHLSEPAFAAQAHLADGAVIFFDDPGCLFAWTARSPAATAVRRSWFHDSRGEGWLSPEETEFVAAAATPMGWGYAAVVAGTGGAGAVSVEAARRSIAARAAG
jgi:hypothetical protein